MHSYCRHADSFKCPRHIRRIPAVLIPAAAYLYCNGSISCCLYRSLCHSCRKLYIFHKCRACACADYLRHGTPHIYVDYVGTIFKNYFHSFSHELRLAAKKLHRHRALFVRNCAQLSCFAVTVADALCRHHFTDHICRSEFLAHKPVCSVCNPCHRCKRRSTCYLNIAYLYGITHAYSPKTPYSCP